MTFGVYTIGTESITSTPGTLTPPFVVLYGREYRTWLDHPDEISDVALPIVDFIVARAAAPTNDAPSPLPIGSLTRSRFYYGYTNAGILDADGNTTFRPLWLYPVSVAMAATPWVRWGAGNRWMNGVIADSSLYGIANDADEPHVMWSPAIGLRGEGTSIIAMQLNDVAGLNLPFPTKIDRWFFHYSEVENVPQNDTIDDIAIGPMNPYLLVSHQGRVVLLDRRRTAGGIATISGYIDHGSIDDILFYSDYLLPTQNLLVTPLDTHEGQSNVDYGEFPKASMQPYNSQLVAEDNPSGFGTIGVVTIDQLFIVRHRGGGVLVSGDLDNPTHHRLPYVESTGGVICKGTHTPIGFVYGSVNGVFTWQGGDTTQRLSPQLDGFFWDHTDSDHESYAGSRGSMAYWDGYVCVPNNYLFDIDGQSWWRLGMQTLAPVSDARAPYNCYDIDENNVLYAFGYRHSADVDEADNTPPVWYTFERNILDDEYTWQSHPLVETRGRVVAFQNVGLLAEGTSDAGEAPTVVVTLDGFDEAGAALTTVVTTFTLALSREPQLLRGDLIPNFTAQYVTVSLHSLDPNGNPAPTIRLVRLGTKQRATTARHG